MEKKFCIICGNELVGQQTKYCSIKCKQKGFRLNNKNYDTNYSLKSDKIGHLLKLKAIKEKGGKCEICGYSNNIAALEFHHKSPEEKEFTLTSRAFFRKSEEAISEEMYKCILLCSNCHQELHHPDLDIKVLEKEHTDLQQPIIYNTRKENKCIDCGRSISKNAIRCVSCDKKRLRKVERPSKDELFMMMKDLPVTSIARKFSVTDNAIRKWCKEYGLPTHKRDYKELK